MTTPLQRFVLLLWLVATPALAAPWSKDANGVQPLHDPASKCQVFAAASVAKALPAMKWSGMCRDGFAEGAGTATFAATADSQPSKTWQGNFHSGFFLGDAKARGRIEAPGGSTVLVEFPTNVNDGSYWVVVSLSGADALPVCGRGAAEVLIEAPHDLAANDDNGLRQMMQRAVVFYRQACPGPITMRLLVVAAEGRGSLGGIGFGAKDKEIARAQLGVGAPPENISGFSNFATGESDQGKKAAALKAQKEQRLADTRTAWLEFSQKNKVTMWATPTIIAANPFRFGDNVVAFAGRFNEMIEPGVALVRDAKGGHVVVTGVPNDALTKPQEVIIAGRVVGQREVAITNRTSVKAPTVTFVAVQSCARRFCMDYLDWTNEEKPPFPWGEDQSKYLKP